MAYELKLEQKAGYLHAAVTGENTYENVTGYLEEIRRECAARGCSRVLIEETLTGPRLTTVPIFRIVQEVGSRAIGMFDALAFVDMNVKKDFLMRFAETVAKNRGIPIRLFASVAEAEAWLTQLGKP